VNLRNSFPLYVSCLTYGRQARSLMQTRKLTTTAAVTVALASACAATPAADAATKFTVRGAGFGHGVGMSQYGAYGYAMQGTGYREILAHYYSGTAIGTQDPSTVRVLLQPRVAIARFSGARRAAGKTVSPAKTYGVRPGRYAGTLDLLSPSGRRLKRVTAPLTVRGSQNRVLLSGYALNGVTSGVYRGALEFRPAGPAGVQAVNAVSLEDYVRGVVSRESPSSWPAEALKAQAVAARTYAVTTSKGGAGWDQYPDTRSQVYGGVSAETPSTDAAVAATADELVTYGGKPVVTYFFSTSGGRTEDVENTTLGTAPVPWLKSVEDPYDQASPKHRWGPYTWSLATADAKLGSLVKGAFKGIEVVRRGESPRIVAADIVGTGGRTRVDGATLRARLGLFDTWAYFTSIKTGKAPKPAPEPENQTPSQVEPTGGVTPEARAATLARHRLAGQVIPAHRGSDVVIQRRSRHRWVAVGNADTDARGRYAFTVDTKGRYRVRYHGIAGPVVAFR
jgi:stage II sporulation protein D